MAIGGMVRSVVRGDAGRVTAGYYASYLLQGLYLVTLARSMDASNYGDFVATLAWVSIVSTASGLGAGNLLVLKVARSVDEFRESFGTSLVYIGVLGAIFCAVGFAGAIVVAPSKLAVICLLFVAESFGLRLVELSMQCFQSKERLGITAAINVAAAGVRLLVVLTLSVILPGSLSASAFAVAYCATMVLSGLSGITAVMVLIDRPRLNGTSVRRSWRDSWPFTVGITSRATYADSDKPVVASVSGDATAGAYNLSYRLVTLAFAPIQAIVFSKNVHFFRAGAGSFRTLQSEFHRLAVRIIALGVGGAGALAIGGLLIRPVFGASFESAYPMLLCLAPLLVVQGLHYALGDLLMGAGKQSTRATVQAGVAALSICLNLSLIPLMGWPGAVLSTLVGEGVLIFTLYLILRRQVIVEKSVGGV